MAAATRSTFRLNPYAPEFIPFSRYTYTTGVNISTSNIETHDQSLYSPYPPIPPPNINPSSSYYYFPTHQTPPPPLSEPPHPHYSSNFYPTNNNPFLFTTPPPQTTAPISTHTNYLPVTTTGERRAFDARNLRKNSWKKISWRSNSVRELGFGSNKNNLKQACNGTTSGTGVGNNRFSSGPSGYGGHGGSEKFGRVVKYEGSVTKGKRFDVVPLQSDRNFTTVMIRNIPSKYTRKMLLHFLERHCLNENEKEKKTSKINNQSNESTVWSAIDFLYLPIDFNSGWNKSYAFVNFTDSRAVWKFYYACHNQKWELFRSSKIREIVSAKIQGKKALVEHFGHTAFACESDDYLPVCFNPPRDGSKVEEYLAESSIKVVGKRIPFSTS